MKTAMKHGTRSRYVMEKCRCPKCTKANRDYQRSRRANIEEPK